VLQKVLKVSGTYQEVYPQLFEQVERYYKLHEMSTTRNHIETYTKGEQNFTHRVRSFEAHYYEEMYLHIKKSGMYNEYRAIINAYLTEYLNNQITKSAERTYIDTAGNLIAEKIKPAKIARLNKMYIAWKTPVQNNVQTEKENDYLPEGT
jgi:hypothetical protein